MHAFKDIYLISALHEKGLPELREYLLQQAQPGAWKLDAADFTDQWPEDVALEVCAYIALFHPTLCLPTS